MQMKFAENLKKTLRAEASPSLKLKKRVSNLYTITIQHNDSSTGRLRSENKMFSNLVSREVNSWDIASQDIAGIWQYWLWSLNSGNTKLETKNQYTQIKLLNFENWCNGEVSNSVKKCKNLTFKVNVLSQKLLEFFLVFFHQRIPI